MFTANDIYNMFIKTIVCVYDFLRKAEFMGVSVLNLLLTCAVVSILISALVNVVQRSPVETGSAKNSRLRSNRIREENRHIAERRHRERLEQNERSRRRR